MVSIFMDLWIILRTLENHQKIWEQTFCKGADYIPKYTKSIKGKVNLIIFLSYLNITKIIKRIDSTLNALTKSN